MTGLLLALMLLLGTARGEALSAEGWRTLVRDAQRHVAQQSPQALVALRRLGGRRVRNPDGSVIGVDDGQLVQLTTAIERGLDGERPREPAFRATSLYLAQLEAEVDSLLDAPPPPYSQAIRPDGTLFATATRPLEPARGDAPWEPAARAGWGRVKAWVGIAMSGRGPGGRGLSAAVLVGTSLAALLLALWPVMRRLGEGGRPGSAAVTGAARWDHSPLGRRLLALLELLARRGVIDRPASRTNGEVLERLPPETRRLLAPVVGAHDRACYGGAELDDAAWALLDDAQRELERTP